MEMGRAAICATRGTRRCGRLHQLRSRRPCGSAGRRCPSLVARRPRSWTCSGIRTTRSRSGPARDVCVLVMSDIIEYPLASVLQTSSSAKNGRKSGTASKTAWVAVRHQQRLKPVVSPRFSANPLDSWSLKLIKESCRLRALSAAGSRAERSLSRFSRRQRRLRASGSSRSIVAPRRPRRRAERKRS